MRTDNAAAAAAMSLPAGAELELNKETTSLQKELRQPASDCR